jgi:oligopeptide transport system ATP-binding protein
MTSQERVPLLSVDGLSVQFSSRRGVVRAVDGLSYDVHAGETLAIVGESGSGKSISAQTVMGTLPPSATVTHGTVRFDGVDLLALPEGQRRTYRGARIGMVFQDSLAALNPVLTVGEQIAELYRVHQGASRGVARDAAIEMLGHVGIPSPRERYRQYPHQFSGGQRQRVMIAIALALRPQLVIADEPTTSLDVTVQDQILQLLADLKAETGMALILISHDLGIVAQVADRVVVMYAGSVAEQAPVLDLFDQPLHPYSRGLLESIPRMEGEPGLLVPIPGSPPNLAAVAPGCAFADRCRFTEARCRDKRPGLETSGPSRQSRCLRWEELRDGTI